MVRDLDGVPGLQKQIGMSKRLFWDPLSDFAHSGSRQLARWIGSDGIRPIHSDVDVADLIMQVNQQGLMAVIGIAALAGVDAQGMSEKAMQLLAIEKARREDAPVGDE